MTTALAPAELAAAALCWLSRMPFGKVTGNRRLGAQVDSYWHSTSCRFCRSSPEELMARIEASWAAINVPGSLEARTLESFDKLPRNVRAARVKEAQEEPWYDAVTRA